MRENTEIRYQTVRCDRFELSSDGMLRAKAKIARIGVQDYYIDGKLIKEFRSEEEVKASSDSFRNKPLTLNHPPEFVDADNAHKYLKGFVSNVEYVDGWLEAEITITHRDAIEKALSTHKYFSCGYFANTQETEGEWIDELGVMGEAGQAYKFDSCQVDISGNHLSLVTSPRAGSQATFCDSTEINISQENNEIVYMTEIKYKDQTFKVDGEDGSKVASLVQDLKNQIDTLEGKVDALVKEKSDLKNELEVKSDSLPLEITERVQLWQQVSSYVDSEPDYSLAPIEIKKLYLKKEFPNLADKIDSAEAGYINGLYDVKPPVKQEIPTISEQVKEAITATSVTDAKTSESAMSKYKKAQQDYIKSRMNKGNC